ncbi:hypothetical protein [Streptomyces sp. NPDC058644]|uniref:hypothetical protein n=1 Tax=unclassified Streptomyces TaxID=2593676 RepID=UPI00365C25CD
MIGHESPSEIAACVSLATGVFGASLVPFFLLIEAEHLVPRRVRESDIPQRAALATLLAWDRARLAAVTALLALLRLAAQKGGAR